MKAHHASGDDAEWAGVQRRLVAWLVDRAVVASPVLAFIAVVVHVSPTPNDGRVHDGNSMAAVSLIAMSEVLYQLICNIAGTSAGKWVCRLRAVRLGDGKRPGLVRGLVRWLVSEVMVFTLPFSLPAYLLCRFDKRRRALQDFASGTAVIRMTRTDRGVELTPALWPR